MVLLVIFSTLSTSDVLTPEISTVFDREDKPDTMVTAAFGTWISLRKT